MWIIKPICIAFSIYSKIPVPQFEWKDKEMKYMLCFFPWIGVVIGIMTVGWGYLCGQFEIGNLCYSLVGTAIPLVITGGFHIDGYMDTMDAFHSYQEKEKKLEILKDPHLGAFSVIMLVLYYLIYIGMYSEISDIKLLAMVGMGFVISRALSGISVVTFQSAKKEGLLYLFADRAHEKVVKTTLYLQLLVSSLMILWLSVRVGILVLILAGGSFIYYRNRSYKEIGGITGDTAGFFVTICELMVIVAVAIGGRLL